MMLRPEAMPVRDGTGTAPAVNPPLWSALRADADELTRLKRRTYAGRTGWADVLTLPAFWCVVLWRLGNTWHASGLRALSRLTYLLNLVAFGADLAPGSVVGPGVVVPHPVGVIVATGCTFGARCRIMGRVTVGGSGNADRLGHPTVGDDVWLLDGVRVLGPVTIGDRCVLGASAVVTRDLPADVQARVGVAPLEVVPRGQRRSRAGG